MKKILLYVSISLLVACSNLHFDNLAYSGYISIIDKANEMKSQCVNRDLTATNLIGLSSLTTHANTYAQYREVSPEVAKSSAILNSMVTEMMGRYDVGGSPSKIYCQEKLKTISRAAEVIADTLGRQE